MIANEFILIGSVISVLTSWRAMAAAENSNKDTKNSHDHVKQILFFKQSPLIQNQLYFLYMISLINIKCYVQFFSLIQSHPTGFF